MSPKRLMVFASLALVASCATEPQVASITFNVTVATLDAIGATVQITPTLADDEGVALSGLTVDWSSSDAAVATVANGLVTAVSNGSATITAAAGSITRTATITVAQAPDEVLKTAGDAQTGPAGVALPTAVEVEVRDRLDVPVSGASVAFTVSGGGSVGSAAVTTGANGRASNTWTLGQVAGVAQGLTAAVAGKSAAFTAVAEVGAPDSLVVVSGDGQSGPASTELPESLRVRVADAFGNAVAGVTVTWSVTMGGGSVDPTSDPTDADGESATAFTLGPSDGTNTAEASVAEVSVGSPAPFTAEAAPGALSIVAGDNQTQIAGSDVNVRPTVLVATAGGVPLAGITITFAVESGGGSVSGAIQVTDATGRARVGSWELGGTPGPNTLSATASGAAFSNDPLTFTATGATAQYDIEIRFINAPTAGQQAAFDAAEALWEGAIFGDLPNVALNAAANACFAGQPAINETIDDLVIHVLLEPIDGPGGTLGAAGPCYLRSAGQLSITGVMRFDTDDLADLEDDGQLEDVILHEMGHVLGIGTLWDNLDLLQNPSLPNSPGVDTHFDGPLAIAAFDDLGGTSYSGGEKVPVENNAAYGPGTRDGHWRESVFNHELMTGIIEASGTANPLSNMSIASLGDLGYLVNYSVADPYTQTFTFTAALQASAVGGRVLVNDILRHPIRVVDAHGRVVRVIQP